MKYKILKGEELKELEEDFIAFLVSNDVLTKDWEKINQDDPDKAIALVEMFSDVVWQKALEKIKVIVHQKNDSLKFFNYLSDKAILVGVNSKKNTVDLTIKDWKSILINDPDSFELFSQIKKVEKGTREKELFSLIQSGCVVGELSDFDWLFSLFNKIKEIN